MGRMGAGVRKFVSLDDTPGSFSGQAGKYSKVNAGEDALEFAVGTAGIVEGEYTTWTYKRQKAVPNATFEYFDYIFWIDDLNDLLYLSWFDSSRNSRLGIYNLADFNPVYETPAGSDYGWYPSAVEYTTDPKIGFTDIYDGGISRSLRTYMLLALHDDVSIAVWRGGLSALWTHPITDDLSAHTVECGAISITGKWIVVSGVVDYWSDPVLLLYEGS